jgi:hypothetical protein
MPYGFNSSIPDHLSGGHVAMGRVTTGRAMMHPNIERLFARVCAAVRTGLGGSIFIDLAKIDIVLPAHPSQNINELPESSVETMFR